MKSVLHCKNLSKSQNVDDYRTNALNTSLVLDSTRTAKHSARTVHGRGKNVDLVTVKITVRNTS